MVLFTQTGIHLSSETDALEAISTSKYQSKAATFKVCLSVCRREDLTATNKAEPNHKRWNNPSVQFRLLNFFFNQ